MPNYFTLPGSEDLSPETAMRAVRIDDMTVAGPALPVNEAGSTPDSALDKVNAAYDSLNRLLDLAGVRLDDMVRLRAWVADYDVLPALAEAWGKWFGTDEDQPAGNVVRADLPAGELIRLEATAITAGDRRHSVPLSGADWPWANASRKGPLVCVGDLRHVTPGGIAPLPEAQELHHRLASGLEALGSGMSELGHILSFYDDHSKRDIINSPFVEYFPKIGDRPARHSVIRRLPDGSALGGDATGWSGASRACVTLSGVWHGGIRGVPNSLPFGTRIGPLLQSAATYGQNPLTEICDDSRSDQSYWAFRNTERLLTAVGMTPADILHAFIWYRTDEDREAALVEWAGWYPDPAQQPVLTLLQSELPRNFACQVEITAYRPTA